MCVLVFVCVYVCTCVCECADIYLTMFSRNDAVGTQVTAEKGEKGEPGDDGTPGRQVGLGTACGCHVTVALVIVM